MTQIRHPSFSGPSVCETPACQFYGKKHFLPHVIKDACDHCHVRPARREKGHRLLWCAECEQEMRVR